MFFIPTRPPFRNWGQSPQTPCQRAEPSGLLLRISRSLNSYSNRGHRGRSCCEDDDGSSYLNSGGSAIALLVFGAVVSTGCNEPATRATTATDAAADQNTSAQVAVTTGSGPGVDSSPTTEPTAKVTTEKNPAAERQPPSNPSRPTAQGRRTTPYLRTASQSRSLPCWNPRCLMPSKPR